MTNSSLSNIISVLKSIADISGAFLTNNYKPISIVADFYQCDRLSFKAFY